MKNSQETINQYQKHRKDLNLNCFKLKWWQKECSNWFDRVMWIWQEQISGKGKRRDKM